MMGSKGTATRGACFGCLAAVILWWIPLPVALAVWMFDLNGPFVDYMLMSLPCYLALPLVGAAVGWLVERRR
jgi:hypothetical protein